MIFGKSAADDDEKNWDDETMKEQGNGPNDSGDTSNQNTEKK